MSPEKSRWEIWKLLYCKSSRNELEESSKFISSLLARPTTQFHRNLVHVQTIPLSIIIPRIHQLSISLQPKQETVSASLTTSFRLTRNHDRSRAGYLCHPLSSPGRFSYRLRDVLQKFFKDQNAAENEAAEFSTVWMHTPTFSTLSPYHARLVTGVPLRTNVPRSLDKATI